MGLFLLALWGITDAQADPFNVLGQRLPPGWLGFNPYVGNLTSDPWAAMIVVYGVAPGLDMAIAGSAYLDGSAVVADSFHVVPRWFPSPEIDLALAPHLVFANGRPLQWGPEMHLSGYATPSVGLWVNTGARYFLGEDLDPQMFTWLGAEIRSQVPFVAVEVDLEATGATAFSATVIPSLGLWLGPEGQTGVSVGWFLPIDDGVGFGGAGFWLWRAVQLPVGARPR